MSVGRPILDKQGNGHFNWKDGRFETHTLIDHTWRGVWFQKGNDRDDGFTVDFSPDFSTGEGCWWYNRIGADYAPTQKGGTFISIRKLLSQASGTFLHPHRKKLLSLLPMIGYCPAGSHEVPHHPLWLEERMGS